MHAKQTSQSRNRTIVGLKPLIVMFSASICRMSQSHHSGIETRIKRQTIRTPRSRNRTIVGLKLLERYILYLTKASRNRTIVGLKLTQHHFLHTLV
mgnify:CR=1 FL=1